MIAGTSLNVRAGDALQKKTRVGYLVFILEKVGYELSTHINDDEFAIVLPVAFVHSDADAEGFVGVNSNTFFGHVRKRETK